MFLVPTYVVQSAIEGLGVFTSVDIKKGDVVWRFDPKFDRVFTPAEVNSFPEPVQDFIAKCAFLDKRKQLYFLGGDYDIFTNHSTTPELIEDPTDAEGTNDARSTQRLIASRDIAAHEELTQNYYEYTEPADAAQKLHLGTSDRAAK